MPAPTVQEVIQLIESEATDAGPLHRLRSASAMARDLAEVGDAALGYFVDQARRAGHSWAEIGDALGVSRQAAQQKQPRRPSFGSLTKGLWRFTPRARNVVASAEAVARELGHGFIGTEHLLLAQYREPDGVGAQVLEAHGIDATTAAAGVAELVEVGPGAPEGKLGLTRRASAAIGAALAAARELGHDYIGTEHLLLGVLDSEGVAAQVLAKAGLGRDQAVEGIAEVLAAHGGRTTGRRRGPRSRGASPRPTGAKRSRHRGEEPPQVMS